MSRHKCFISYKTEDQYFKDYIQNNLDIDMIDKSLNTPIDSNDEDYIMRVIRERHLSDSTVTICLIGKHSAENLGWEEQRYIKRELQASLYNGDDNTRNGILGVVLPDMIDTVYAGTMNCSVCGNVHNVVKIDNTTVVREFSYNYYLPPERCAWAEDDRYCVLTDWYSFSKNPDYYIELAFDKRKDPVASKVRVRP